MSRAAMQVPLPGVGQMTLAGQLTMAGGMRSSRPAGRRRKRKASARGPTTRRASKRRVARLVKGSKAAKAYMAKIRRKRR